MTLKQKVFLKKLPENNYNMSKTMKAAGYTRQTSVAGEQYRILRNLTSKLDFFNPERIKEDINATRKLAVKEKDITNLNRIDEHRSKIAGMLKDKMQDNPDERFHNIINLYTKKDNTTTGSIPTETKQITDGPKLT